ncbi:SDR family oxidoreductase [Neptuniibacter caesariensis]|uniref:Short chain dehydrogenase family protein n=1 Tax=Neptuniibacter caesariensis TaxID=207954 RepID=A0A7U8GTJ0_NEPCE|nr:SDR family oxidoreductase [Neptuniibacter caesariensis]EAR62347.1 Short chain dehydrogenase family protein [Oceanospirillum sp. MED92] [Neptuniibacter caesariensis]
MGKHLVITGANRGIGLAFVKHYCTLGYQVTVICRQSSPELEELPCRIISDIDVSNASSVERLSSELDNTQIDILINNAGILTSESLEQMSFDDIMTQFEVNAVAPLRVTHALLGNLKKGSKVINITSRMGSMADNGSGGYYGYRASKAALNAFGKSLAMDLKAQGIMVAQLHPGLVSTRMIGFNGDVTPDQAVAGLTQRIEGLTLQNTGSFWHANGEELPW